MRKIKCIARNAAEIYNLGDVSCVITLQPSIISLIVIDRKSYRENNEVCFQ